MNVLEELIYPAVDEAASAIDQPDRLVKSPGTKLFGRGAALDSLALVSFILVVEEQIRKRAGVDLTLADEKAMSPQTSPFRTLATLAEYVRERLEEPRNG